MHKIVAPVEKNTNPLPITKNLLFYKKHFFYLEANFTFILKDQQQSNKNYYWYLGQIICNLFRLKCICHNDFDFLNQLMLGLQFSTQLRWKVFVGAMKNLSMY